jgi:hypothetical protein
MVDLGEIPSSNSIRCAKVAAGVQEIAHPVNQEHHVEEYPYSILVPLHAIDIASFKASIGIFAFISYRHHNEEASQPAPNHQQLKQCKDERLDQLRWHFLQKMRGALYDCSNVSYSASETAPKEYDNGTNSP